jgi:hypothetical protein
LNLRRRFLSAVEEEQNNRESPDNASHSRLGAAEEGGSDADSDAYIPDNSNSGTETDVPSPTDSEQGDRHRITFIPGSVERLLRGRAAVSAVASVNSAGRMLSGHPSVELLQPAAQANSRVLSPSFSARGGRSTSHQPDERTSRQPSQIVSPRSPSPFSSSAAAAAVSRSSSARLFVDVGRPSSLITAHSPGGWTNATQGTPSERALRRGVGTQRDVLEYGSATPTMPVLDRGNASARLSLGTPLRAPASVRARSTSLRSVGSISRRPHMDVLSPSPSSSARAPSRQPDLPKSHVDDALHLALALNNPFNEGLEILEDLDIEHGVCGGDVLRDGPHSSATMTPSFAILDPGAAMPSRIRESPARRSITPVTLVSPSRLFIPHTPGSTRSRGISGSSGKNAPLPLPSRSQNVTSSVTSPSNFSDGGASSAAATVSNTAPSSPVPEHSTGRHVAQPPIAARTPATHDSDETAVDILPSTVHVSGDHPSAVIVGRWVGTGMPLIGTSTRFAGDEKDQDEVDDIIDTLGGTQGGWFDDGARENPYARFNSLTTAPRSASTYSVPGSRSVAPQATPPLHRVLSSRAVR